MHFRRNNSARELSAFAESAMAMNRVVLQHFSVNLEELLKTRDPRLSTSSTDDDNHPYGHMSDSSSELFESHSSGEFEAIYSKSPACDNEDPVNIRIPENLRLIEKNPLNLFGLSPPSESRLMQRRLKARSDLLQRQSAPIVASPSG